MARWAVCVVLLAALAGCTSSKPSRVVTVTAQAPSDQPSSPAATTSAPPPTPTTSPMTRLTGTCDSLLPDPAVDGAIGVASLPGTDAFVVGQPESDIHRLGYLNCRYGVTGRGSAAKPAIEIGISLYRTAHDASSRITATVDDYAAHGASASDVKVGGLQARMLTGGIGDGYNIPTLVVASGQRTVAVSVAGSVATGAKANTDAAKLAALALNRTRP